MKKLLTIALALSTLSAPALARDHYGRGYDRGYGRDYGYVHAPRGYNSCRGSNADGTVLGAVAGGALGNAVSDGDRTRGTIIGGLLGGVLGNVIDSNKGRCGR